MLYANTDDGSSALWVCDGNGVVVDNISYSIGERAPILEQINEHYGTSFTGWSDNEISLRVGDSVPNWNVYEKIVDTSQKIAVLAMSYQQNYTFIIGKLSGENFEIITNGSNSCGVNADGVVVSYSLPGADNTNYVKGILQGRGIITSSVTEKVVSWEIGDSVPDWSEYTQYT